MSAPAIPANTIVSVPAQMHSGVQGLSIPTNLSRVTLLLSLFILRIQRLHAHPQRRKRKKKKTNTRRRSVMRRRNGILRKKSLSAFFGFFTPRNSENAAENPRWRTAKMMTTAASSVESLSSRRSRRAAAFR